MPDSVSGSPEQLKPELPRVEESGLEADERAAEASPELQDQFLEEESPTTKVEVPERKLEQAKSATATPATQPVVKDDLTREVEEVLEEGLGDVFATLPPPAKLKFKEKGEQAAREIAEMVRTLKVKFRRALELIRDWLLTIPNSNKFFLEQEAKIKVDKIMQIVEERKQDANKQV
jgi:hypothetical protein